MCVAIPAEIISIDGTDAEVNIGGTQRRASIYLTPGAQVGDYVLLHAGFAIRVIDADEAHATIELLRDINAANG